ncbi:serine/threonine protein kinase [Polytolypa hystricis UAMH7299]|uniref:Serine/threonine protein kinase n=1 Tax=Polytolypa hystricis (strain UAMH7299) TaxID=1447883 RepID=A0A2B7WHB7_POLH7|nr:serine/threonine protein kinase [Polytolypa hystricis UAMH7299]
MTTTRRQWIIDSTCSNYNEVKWKRGQEPRKRSLHLTTSFACLQWHITVSFEGSLHSDAVARAKVGKRRQDLEDLCTCLDFNCLHLVDDTVTELLITREHDGTPPSHLNNIALAHRPLPLKKSPHPDSEYTPVLAHLRFCVREDPFHVRFPPYDSEIGTPIKDLSKICKVRRLRAGVHEVRVKGDNTSYVYKEVDIPLYMPRDSQVLEQELRNLQLFRGNRFIVQIVAAIVSKNPYRTSRTDEASNITEDTSPTVLRGILLHYHPKGTLSDALQDISPKTTRPWGKWALQISCGLACLHQAGVTHMDLKPSNVVISTEGNALLIDISGIGGITREWLAPEMHDILDPLSESLESRKQNDIWALGNMLSTMAKRSHINVEKQRLEHVAAGATAADPSLRYSLYQIISTLSQLSTQ